MTMTAKQKLWSAWYFESAKDFPPVLAGCLAGLVHPSAAAGENVPRLADTGSMTVVRALELLPRIRVWSARGINAALEEAAGDVGMDDPGDVERLVDLIRARDLLVALHGPTPQSLLSVVSAQLAGARPRS
jgi:hypothetical protein